MSTTLMTDDPRHRDSDVPRRSVQERLAAHRARREAMYGPDRNDVEVDPQVVREAAEFQASVHKALRDAS